MNHEEADRYSRKLYHEYTSAKSEFEVKLARELRQEEARLRELHAPELATIQAMYADYVKASHEATNIAQANAMAGVNAKWPIGTKLGKKTGAHGLYRIGEHTIYGVYEPVTRDTKHPDNYASYARAHIGSYIVRLYNKSGELGKRYDTSTYGWEPVEQTKGTDEANA
jgi:hypothetical protein